MFQILSILLMFSCSKSQTSLSKIKSADVTSCVDNATQGLKEKFGSDYSCFTTDFSTMVDGDNLSAQCQSIITQCQSISQSTQISQNTSVPLSNNGSEMLDNSGVPITGDNPVAPEYNTLNQNSYNTSQIPINSSNNLITDPSFSFRTPIDGNLGFSDPYTLGVYSPVTSNEPYSNLLGTLSANYKYDSDIASKIINTLSQPHFTVAGGYPCGADPFSFTGFCFACVGNSFAALGKWTDAMDGPNRNEARSVAQVSDATALQSGYLNITANYPKCGPMNSNPVNPAPPPGTMIV